MINFGKYNKKSYDYVIDNDKDYCIWIIKQNIKPDKKPNNIMFPFYEYIKNNIIKLYNVKNLVGIYKIACTQLVDYMICDVAFMDLVVDLQINENKLGYNIIKNQHKSYYGQFIDYLIRYEIALEHLIPFYDDRTKYVLLHNDNHIIRQSYNNMVNKIASINDIFNVSLCHSLFFGNIDSLQFIDTLKDYDIVSHNNIKKYVANLEFNHILINPVLNNYDLGIIGDADIIMDNTIIDIKISDHIGTHIYDFIQLMIYAVTYYRNTGRLCTKLKICNLLKGNEYIVNINEQLIDKINVIIGGYSIKI